jgi:hypothetical protein
MGKFVIFEKLPVREQQAWKRRHIILEESKLDKLIQSLEKYALGQFACRELSPEALKQMDAHALLPIDPAFMFFFEKPEDVVLLEPDNIVVKEFRK